MADKSDAAVVTKSTPRELVITRIFDAPRALVFEAWTKPEHLVHWFCPNGFTLPVCEMDFRVGGSQRLCMRASGGWEHYVRGVYREIVPAERIVWTSAFEDVPGSEVVTTVTFADHEGKDSCKTKLTVHQTFSFESDATRGAPQGWTETLEHLAAYVAKNLNGER
jgi:uncharacterized protein YndB with AHSA1/START domain